MPPGGPGSLIREEAPSRMPTHKSASTGGMQALFSEINQGAQITSGLRKARARGAEEGGGGSMREEHSQRGAAAGSEREGSDSCGCLRPLARREQVTDDMKSKNRLDRTGVVAASAGKGGQGEPWSCARARAPGPLSRRPSLSLALAPRATNPASPSPPPRRGREGGGAARARPAEAGVRGRAQVGGGEPAGQPHA